MFYIANQSYHWQLNQSEVAISGLLTNQIVRRGVSCNTSASYNLLRTSPYHYLPLSPPFSYIIVYIYIYIYMLCSTPRVSESYNLRTSPYHYLPLPAILFSLCASYNLIIFYKLALSLIFCPFTAILFS